MTGAPAIVIAAALLAAGTGCSSDSGAAHVITVSAAASLRAAFADIGTAFTAENPGITVRFNLASSTQLASQILDGAPADVAAFADTRTMEALRDARLLDGPAALFATNRLVIATAPGNPSGIATVADLARVGVVALCDESAPCGRFADALLAESGVDLPATSITRAPDVAATLAALTEGDAQAAVVYATDALAAGDAVETIETPSSDARVARYPIAVLRGSDQRPSARAFAEFVRGDSGQAILRRAGFGPAP